MVTLLEVDNRRERGARLRMAGKEAFDEEDLKDEIRDVWKDEQFSECLGRAMEIMKRAQKARRLSTS